MTIPCVIQLSFVCLPRIKTLVMTNKKDIQGLIKSAKGKIFSGSYVKKDGSLRKFNGKSHYNSELAGGEPNLSEDQVAYFDINANGWRSFKVDALLELNINGDKMMFNDK